MNKEILKKLSAFFNGSRPGWQDANSFLEKNLDQLDFEDESVVYALTDISLFALGAHCENISFLKFLVSKGFDINYKLEGDDCLLLKYIRSGIKPSVIEELAALGADIYSETLDGDNVLSLLAGQEESAAVKMAEDYDLTQFDSPDSTGMTPLMHAAMKGYYRLAELLIRQGFDVNGIGGAPANDDCDEIETAGVSPLTLAIRFGNVDMVKLLLAEGADETLCDAEGNPPIFSLLRYPPDFSFSSGQTFSGRASGSGISGGEISCGRASGNRISGGRASGSRISRSSLSRDRISHDEAALRESDLQEDSPQEDELSIFQDKLKILSMLEQLDISDDQGYTLLMKCLFLLRDWRCGHRGSIMPPINEAIAMTLIERGADVNSVGNDGKRPLHQAVLTAEQVARKLLDAGADINAQDNDGNTPLHIACTDAEEDTVIWLLKAGADHEIQNNDGRTPQNLAMENGLSRALDLMKPQEGLLAACKDNQRRTVQILLKNGGEDINRPDELGNTPLIYACRHNARDIVRLLLNHHADPNLANRQNHAPLHFAAKLGSSDIITLLMNAGADPNRTDDAGLSPLMLLIQSGKAAAALSLIKNPAVDVGLQDSDGRTALVYAVFAGQQQLVKALLPFGAAGTDASGNTPLHYACHNGYAEIARTLIERDKNTINCRNADGETPLLFAARKSKLVAAKLLLEQGAETDLANLKGLTPLHFAAYNGDIPMGRALLEAGAHIDAKTQDGQTPLMYAVISRKSEFAEMLLEEDADIKILDNKAQSALYYATEANLLKIVELLLAKGAKN